MRKNSLRHRVCSAQPRWHLCPPPLILYYSVMPLGQIAVFVYEEVPQGRIVISILHVAFCALGIIRGVLSPQSMFFLTAACFLGGKWDKSIVSRIQNICYKLIKTQPKYNTCERGVDNHHLCSGYPRKGAFSHPIRHLGIMPSSQGFGML